MKGWKWEKYSHHAPEAALAWTQTPCPSYSSCTPNWYSPHIQSLRKESLLPLKARSSPKALHHNPLLLPSITDLPSFLHPVLPDGSVFQAYRTRVCHNPQLYCCRVQIACIINTSIGGMGDPVNLHLWNMAVGHGLQAVVCQPTPRSPT
jgi:hypothetical protein